MIGHLVIIAAGVISGIFTGFIPGLHPNTVVFGSLPLYFGSGIDFISYMSFISGMSVSHTFHDFLPAIFLGVPEAESALSALPGAEMAAEGLGGEAYLYTVAGGAVSVTAIVASAPFLLIFLEPIYTALEEFMGQLLLFFLLVIIFRSDRLLNSVVIASLSGALGLATFSMPVNQEFVLLPVFAGLFAAPSVFHALKSDLRPGVQQSQWELDREGVIRGGAVGSLAGAMAGVFPGMGAATSTSFLTPLIDSRREFLAGMGGVNTSDILMSFISLYTIGKARSGSSVALQSLSEVTPPVTGFLIGASLFSAGIAVAIAPTSLGFFVSTLERLDFRKLLLSVLFLLTAVTFHLTGFPGLLILATGAFLGYAALLAGERAACMAVLMVPAIAFYTKTALIMS